MATAKKRKQKAESEAQSESAPTSESALATAADEGAAVSNSVQQLETTARAAFEQGRDESRQWVEGIETAIREKPIRSVLVATGVGFIIALLWR